MGRNKKDATQDVLNLYNQMQEDENIESGKEEIKVTLKEIESAKKALYEARRNWAKTGMREFTMRYAVNDYLEASGANRPSIGGEETILAHRKIAANRLAIDCIYALSKEELSKVDRELEGITGDLPRQNRGLFR